MIAAALLLAYVIGVSTSWLFMRRRKDHWIRAGQHLTEVAHHWHTDPYVAPRRRKWLRRNVQGHRLSEQPRVYPRRAAKTS